MQGKAEQGRAELGRTSKDRAELGKTKQGRAITENILYSPKRTKSRKQTCLPPRFGKKYRI